MKFRVFLFVLALSVQNIAIAGLDEANAAYDKNDYASALKEFKPLALLGNAVAQNKLGVMYSAGRGVQKDDNQAADWFRKAAEQGNSRGQFNLGVMYATGRGVP